MDDDNELHCPNIDVCAWCGDSECQGIGCIASIDPNDEHDQDELGYLHQVIRAGKVWVQAIKFLDQVENR